jgi:hypothetical protein
VEAAMRDRTLSRCAATVALLVAVLLPDPAAAREDQDPQSDVQAAVATPLEAGADAFAQDPIELFRVRIDTRMCPAPFCGGAFVSRINQPETHCADGEYRETCYVTRVDLESADLTDPQLAHIYGAMYAGQVLLGGRIEQVFSPAWGLAGEFRATDVWRSATDAVDESAIFRVRDNGIRCFAAPCFSYDLVVVNSPEVMAVSDVGLANVGATPEMLAAATEALFTTGVLATGTMHDQPAAGPAGTGRLFDATQFYIPITRGIMIPPIR